MVPVSSAKIIRNLRVSLEKNAKLTSAMGDKLCQKMGHAHTARPTKEPKMGTHVDLMHAISQKKFF